MRAIFNWRLDRLGKKTRLEHETCSEMILREKEEKIKTELGVARDELGVARDELRVARDELVCALEETLHDSSSNS